MMLGLLRSRRVLLLAFAFSIMGDPVSSVAYAIEAALRALNGDLDLLLATMVLVVSVVVLVAVNYHLLIGRFPEGGGAAAAVGAAFSDPWAFLPIGALIVDFCLTISISIAAATSAIIADVTQLSDWRIPMALLLLLVVAVGSLFGHGGRLAFALMTLLFLGVAVIVIAHGFLDPTEGAAPPVTAAAPHSPIVAVLLAFPVAMALATGIEAPSSGIAQLGQLDDAGRRFFGRTTLWLTVGIVGALTLALTLLATRLNVGIPAENSTQIADIARRSVGDSALFSLFQWASALLLLAAASSSFQAGPGLLKALAGETAVLPAPLARVNRFHTPVFGVAFFALAAATCLLLAGGRDQELVLFYAVAVFLSFLGGLIAMAAFAHRAGHHLLIAINLIGAGTIAFVLLLNLTRGYPLVSLGASLLVSALLYARWVRAGRPSGVSEIEAEAATEQ